MGFDLNEKFIEAAKKNYGENIRFDVCDITDENRVAELYGDAKFDVVTSFMALHWTNFSKALKVNSNQLLNTEGKFVMTVSVPQSFKYMLIISRLIANEYPKWAKYILDFEKIKASNYGLCVSLQERYTERYTYERCF
jgi:SAM-dependent methyltransferase